MKKTTTQTIDFSQQQLTPTEQKSVRGGKQVLAGIVGSTSFVDWGEIDVREDKNDVTLSNNGG